MTTGTKLILALGGAGLAYVAYRWWEGQQAPPPVGYAPGSVSMPPLGAPPVPAGGALPQAGGWATRALVPPPPAPGGQIFSAGLARIAARVAPSTGPATETAAGRSHF